MIAGLLHHPPDRRQLRQVADWLRHIGIPVTIGERFEPPFNSGLWVESGGVVYDPTVAHVGDLLHEAGHLAVLPSSVRQEITAGDIDSAAGPLIYSMLAADPRDETALASIQTGDEGVIAWSWAAAIEAGVPPRVTLTNGFFDPTVRENTHQWLVSGEFSGIAKLRVAGFTDQWPKMKRWLLP